MWLMQVYVDMWRQPFARFNVVARIAKDQKKQESAAVETAAQIAQRERAIAVAARAALDESSE